MLTPMKPRTFVPVVAMVMCSAAVADNGEGVTLLTDSRTAMALANTTQCPDQGFTSNTEAPETFEPFSVTIEADQSCDDGTAHAAATQQSEVSTTSMSGFGTTLAVASGALPGVIHAIPRSTFEVTFQVTQSQDMVIDASLLTAGDHGPPVIFAHSTVRLWSDWEDPIFSHIHTSETPGFFEIAETVTLEPGEYTIRVESAIAIDGVVPPDANAGATFEFDMQLTPTPFPGDLNGDGIVDVSDLLILLAAWGPCDDERDCPADLNGDGTVNVSDLLLLLANWG